MGKIDRLVIGGDQRTALGNRARNDYARAFSACLRCTGDGSQKEAQGNISSAGPKVVTQAFVRDASRYVLRATLWAFHLREIRCLS